MRRASPASSTPASRSRSVRLSWVLREPITPMYPTLLASAPTTAGTSNFASWVSTHTASRGPNVGADRVEQTVGPVDDDLVGEREAGLGGKHLTGVAHRDAVAEDLGDAAQRGREVDRAEDQHARRRRERLDEHRHRLFAGLAVLAVVAHDDRPGFELAQRHRGRRPGRDRRCRANRSVRRRGAPASWRPVPGPSITVASATGRSARIDALS